MRIEATYGTQPNTGTEPRNSKLADAAKQFESLMIEQLLKPFNDKETSWKTDDESSGGSDTLMGFGVQSMAGAIAKGGGLGIARQITEKIARESRQVEGKSSQY